MAESAFTRMVLVDSSTTRIRFWGVRGSIPTPGAGTVRYGGNTSSWSRLYSQYDSTGEFYKFGLLNFSGTHVMGLPQFPVYIALTAGSYWRQGDPSKFDRVAPYISAVGIYAFTRELQLTAFIRPEFQIYLNDADKAGRKDFNLTVGSTLSWTPVQYVTVGATASYVGNFSNAGARGYNVVTPAVILAASIAF